MERQTVLTIALLFLTGLSAPIFASQQVQLPELSGEYIGNDTVRYATAVFGQPIAAPDSLIVHWRGQFEPGTALVNGNLESWGGCINLLIEDPGAHGFAGLCWPLDGAFDSRSAFICPDFDFLQDGQCALVATFWDNLPGPDDTFELVIPPTCRLEYVELRVRSAVPVQDTTWGAIKERYR